MNNNNDQKPFVLAITSTKGGVGRSTLSANLAVILSAQAIPVTLIAADFQDTLLCHFGRDELAQGWAKAWLSGQPFPVCSVTPTLSIMPVGPASISEQAVILSMARTVLPALVGAVAKHQRGGVVIIDTAVGNHLLTQHTLDVAQGVLSIWLCDQSSLNAYDRQGTVPVSEGTRHAHVINQINATREVRREVLRGWRTRLGASMVPVPVHQDEFVPEALHARTTVVLASTFSQAAHDFRGVADWFCKEWLSGDGA